MMIRIRLKIKFFVESEIKHWKIIKEHSKQLLPLGAEVGEVGFGGGFRLGALISTTVLAPHCSLAVSCPGLWQ